MMTESVESNLDEYKNSGNGYYTTRGNEHAKGNTFTNGYSAVSNESGFGAPNGNGFCSNYTNGNTFDKR